MSGWLVIEQELARWRDAGRELVLWWRDDDAADTTPALDRLLALQRAHDVPLALAVVPASATAALAERLAEAPGIDLLQHGYAHTNHAPARDNKKEELGAHRPAMMVLGELATGRMALERLFGSRPLAVLVPPWNRIAPGLVPALPEIGYRGLSTFGIRRRVSPVSGLLQVNTHLDLIDWKARRFAGADALLAALAAALSAARETGEPIGLLSHHLAMDEAAWSFLQSFWGAVKGMPGVRIAAAHEIFACREARA
jgi:peptidoglycan/xylan/chitin deacetylase (PgdA/CDA1 family)